MYKMNKKGTLGRFSHDFVAFIAAFTVVVFFLIMVSVFVTGNNKTISQNSEFLQEKIKEKVEIRNLFNEKIVIDNQEISFLELVRLSITNTDYKQKFNENYPNINIEKKEFCSLEENCIYLPSNNLILIEILKIK